MRTGRVVRISAVIENWGKIYGCHTPRMEKKMMPAVVGRSTPMSKCWGWSRELDGRKYQSLHWMRYSPSVNQLIPNHYTISKTRSIDYCAGQILRRLRSLLRRRNVVKWYTRVSRCECSDGRPVEEEAGGKVSEQGKRPIRIETISS